MTKGSKILRNDWVEAKSVEHLDPDIEVGHVTNARVSIQGHNYLLSDNSHLHETVSSNQGLFLSADVINLLLIVSKPLTSVQCISKVEI